LQRIHITLELSIALRLFTPPGEILALTGQTQVIEIPVEYPLTSLSVLTRTGAAGMGLVSFKFAGLQACLQ